MMRWWGSVALSALSICVWAQSPTSFPNPDSVLKAPSTKGSAHAEINPNGTFAVYGDPGQMIQLSSLSLSGDASLLAAGATPGTVDLWDVQRHKLLKTYSGADVAVLAPDHIPLMVTGAISVVDLRTRKERCRFAWHPDDANATVNRMHLSPDGQLLAVTINGSNILVFNTDTCKQVANLDRTRDGDFTPDGAKFFAADYQVMTLWQVKGWKLLATFPAGPDYTTGLVVSPSGEEALIAGPNNAKLVRIRDGSTIRNFGDGWVSAVGFLNDDVLLVRDHHQLAFWSTDGRLLCSNDKIESGDVALARDGSLAVGAGHQRDVLFWSAGTIAKACHVVN